MAYGRVITGYSFPVYSIYTPGLEGGPNQYDGCHHMARGVSVAMNIETSGNDNIFHADNVAAESAASVFTSGTATLTSDSFKDAVRQAIQGIGNTLGGNTITVDGREVKLTVFDDHQETPYLGIGWIVRVQEEGNVTYIPYILPKTQATPETLNAVTQGETIEFQTTELEFNIFRDDTTDHRWQIIAEAQATEEDAYAVLEEFFKA